jgi:DNA polymerase-3 subunit delta
MKVKEPQLLSALGKADAAVRFYLLHGPDEAAAASHAARLLSALGPDAESTDIEPGSLRGQPGRLVDEARSLSLFGGRRMIRLTGIGDDAMAAVEMLLAAERVEHPVLAIGPGLKKGAKLLKLAEAHRAAMVCACYLPEGDAADRLVISLARDLGLRARPGAARRLAIATGGDRAVMARELEKLALYLDASPEAPCDLDETALDAVGADLSESAIGPAILAMLAGKPALLGAELQRMREGGDSAIPLLRSAVRQLMTLAELRAEVDRGARPATLVQRIFWKEREATERALSRWRAPDIARAIG